MDGVILEDQTLRDGLQIESRYFSFEEKCLILKNLIDAGFRRIQLGSLVRPDLVPQMKDTGALFSRFKSEYSDFSVLILNEKGLDGAARLGIGRVCIGVSASAAHSMKNANVSMGKANVLAIDLIRRARKMKIYVQVSIMCSFGCSYEGMIDSCVVNDMALRFAESGADEIVFSDTTGMACPSDIRKTISEFMVSCGHVPVALHMHDTRGLALLNMLTGYEMGVRHFDVCTGGLGGCPFVNGASGNAASEDAVHMFERIGIHTGVDLQKICDLTSTLERLLERPLPGKMNRVLKSNQPLLMESVS